MYTKHGGISTAHTSASEIGRLNERLQSLSSAFMRRCAQGDWPAAQELNRQAMALAPQHPHVLADAGLCHLRLGEYELARQAYAWACERAPSDPNMWDGLTEACGHLGLHAQVRLHGRHALGLKHAQTRDVSPRSLSNVPLAKQVLHSRQVIAFSLFGQNPRYCETAILNVQQAKRLLPDWVCRFYLDDSVPEGVCLRLEAMEAQVHRVSAADQVELSPLMWRFLVLADDQIDRFLLRDADSLISSREQAAVQAWLDSGCHFHLMRDYFTHTELLLAGMWGGCAGVWPDVRELMLSFGREGKFLTQRVADQHFLRRHIWPTVQQSLCSHDPVFSFMGGMDFPAHPPHGLGEDFHVGCNLSTMAISAPSTLPDGQSVHWQLQDEQGREVCSYASPVRQGKWLADLPRPYIEQLQQRRWSVKLLP